MSGPSVPWSLIAPYEQQAKDNHGQSLEELAARGGLSPGELWCAVHAKHWSEAPDAIAAHSWLVAWLEADKDTTITRLRALLGEALEIGERQAGLVAKHTNHFHITDCNRLLSIREESKR